MKMSYHLKNRAKIISGSVIVVVVFFLILLTLSFLFPNFFRNNLTIISKPIWAVRQSIISGTENLSGFFSSKSSLIDENKALKDELSIAKLKLTDYDLLLKENQELKGISKDGLSANLSLVRVISKPPISPYDTLVLDGGTAEGIKKGSKVFLGNNVIIGLISDVTPHTSLVELFSRGDVKYNFVLERTGASYDVIGRGGFNMVALVPKEADVLWGDTFIYPGKTSSTVGSVYYIDTDSQSAFKAVYIKIPGNVFQSKWVFVQNM